MRRGSPAGLTQIRMVSAAAVPGAQSAAPNTRTHTRTPRAMTRGAFMESSSKGDWGADRIRKQCDPELFSIQFTARKVAETAHVRHKSCGASFALAIRAELFLVSHHVAVRLATRILNRSRRL